MMSIAVFLAGCGGSPVPHVNSRIPPDRAIQEDRVREAVLQYQVESRDFKGPIFLSIDGEDPSDDFMTRIADGRSNLKKASEAYFKKNPFPGWLRDRVTNEKGVLYNTSAISWLSPIRVEVNGGSYCGGLCADWGIFDVVKKDGHWKVERYRVLAVS